MLSINTLPTTITQFVSGLSVGKFDIKRFTDSVFRGDAALQSAYAKFSNSYGNWVDAHFDEHFLSNGGATVLADFTGGRISRQEAAFRLAETWSEHLGTVRTAVRKRHIADVTMAADSLLSWVESPLARNAVSSSPSTLS